MKFTTRKLVSAAMVAAIYATLTMVLSFSGYGLIQYRIAEALTVLPAFSSIHIYSLFVGCMIANLLSPYGWLDIVVGSLASLLAAIATYYIGKSKLKYKKYLVPIPSVLFNALIVGGLLYYEGVAPTFLIGFLHVGWGQIVCAYILGILFYTLIEKKTILKRVFTGI
ncbi:QueT transporter family protein [Clostridium thermarum]|uniref:QueT transporter family protein n=1 Tax=Clostridium thermarum TaxID=1716543 RepID=UPI001120EBCF|nr:QueT transporter family protein [Clostridium thermarum]